MWNYVQTWHDREMAMSETVWSHDIVEMRKEAGLGVGWMFIRPIVNICG